jgi:hypothetical protein
VAAKLHVYSCKSSVKQEVDAFTAIVSLLPEPTRSELLTAQGRIAILSEPNEETAAQAKK